MWSSLQIFAEDLRDSRHSLGALFLDGGKHDFMNSSRWWRLGGILGINEFRVFECGLQSKSETINTRQVLLMISSLLIELILKSFRNLTMFCSLWRDLLLLLKTGHHFGPISHSCFLNLYKTFAKYRKYIMRCEFSKSPQGAPDDRSHVLLDCLASMWTVSGDNALRIRTDGEERI